MASGDSENQEFWGSWNPRGKYFLNEGNIDLVRWNKMRIKRLSYRTIWKRCKSFTNVVSEKSGMDELETVGKNRLRYR